MDPSKKDSKGAAVVQHRLLLSRIREHFNSLGAKVKVV